MTDIRHDWTVQEGEALYQLPLVELLYQAHSTHRRYFDPNAVQLSTLLSIKTGACPEDCAYCPQSGHYHTDVVRESLLSVDEVRATAEVAKAQGATRFCMGAAWRSPPARDFPQVIAMIRAVKVLGLETCATLGMLSEAQACELKAAGLDYYNHNLDTSAEFYQNIITTRVYQDRLDTLQRVREAGIHVCCGGIIGMGESREDRIGLLLQLANLPTHPDSVPINRLIAMAGTPLEKTPPLDDFEFIRTIAVARLMLPQSVVRLSAGREGMSDAVQLLCFFAGANSIFLGDRLLTAPNPETQRDFHLLKTLGLQPLLSSAPSDHVADRTT
ncbi:MAG: biotin synthase BioB [Coxiella sp. RIFCSPHIGHO2_12_FULL_44_14]|nr:MAG: biotin synthase BioB [Coxiella sp. RIFCSPHIGHO2_12_FULL_44_14]